MGLNFGDIQGLRVYGFGDYLGGSLGMISATMVRASAVPTPGPPWRGAKG